MQQPLRRSISLQLFVRGKVVGGKQASKHSDIGLKHTAVFVKVVRVDASCHRSDLRQQSSSSRNKQQGQRAAVSGAVARTPPPYLPRHGMQ